MTEPSGAAVPDGLLEVGVIRRPHGVKGDTYIDLLTDREDRLAVGSRVWARGAWRLITSSRRLPQRWLVHFDGLDDRTTVEVLTNAPIFAEPVDDPDALWVHQLVGSAVVEVDGTERGVCVAVVANPANDLLELDSGALVPVNFVVDFADGIIRIDPPAGLFDLLD